MMDERVDLCAKYDFDALCVDNDCPVPGSHGAGAEGCAYLVGSAEGNIKRISPDVKPDDWDDYIKEFDEYVRATGDTPERDRTVDWSDFETRDDYQFWVLQGRPTNWAYNEQL